MSGAHEWRCVCHGANQLAGASPTANSPFDAKGRHGETKEVDAALTLYVCVRVCATYRDSINRTEKC